MVRGSEGAAPLLPPSLAAPGRWAGRGELPRGATAAGPGHVPSVAAAGSPPRRSPSRVRAVRVHLHNFLIISNCFLLALALSEKRRREPRSSPARSGTIPPLKVSERERAAARGLRHCTCTGTACPWAPCCRLSPQRGPLRLFCPVYFSPTTPSAHPEAPLGSGGMAAPREPAEPAGMPARRKAGTAPAARAGAGKGFGAGSERTGNGELHSVCSPIAGLRETGQFPLP